MEEGSGEGVDGTQSLQSGILYCIGLTEADTVMGEGSVANKTYEPVFKRE